MNYMATGVAEEAVSAFSQCLEIDNAQRLCRKYRSISNLFLDRKAQALVDAEYNAEQGYFSDFDVYIPAFLQEGNNIAAYTVSRNIYWWRDFPHKQYVGTFKEAAGERDDVAQDILDWADANKVNIVKQTNVMLAVRAYDRITVESFDNDYEDLWLPQFSHYRKGEEFKKLAADLGLTAYWREVGFPPQCRSVSETDYECD